MQWNEKEENKKKKKSNIMEKKNKTELVKQDKFSLNRYEKAKSKQIN